MSKPLDLKPEHLEQIEELTEEDLKKIAGGKDAMPVGDLRTYKLLKIRQTALGGAPTTKLPEGGGQ